MARLLKPSVFLLCLLPLAWLAWQATYGSLGVNPVETLNRYLGDWALRFLLIALAVTPVRKLTGWSRLARVRRMLGLFAFFYVCLHLMSYLGVDLYFDWQALWRDIVKRFYITLGMAAFVLLLPLAITSTDAMIRRMGGRRWRNLHRFAYVAGILGVAHYWFLVKADIREPLLYGVILAALLGVRAVWAVRDAFRRRAGSAAA